jgi:hypothetical protein
MGNKKNQKEKSEPQSMYLLDGPNVARVVP